MKRYLILTALAVLLLAAGCASQETRGPGQAGGPDGPGGPGGPVSTEQRVADMRTKLGLTDEQAAAVKPIIEEQTRRKKAIMDQAGSGSDARKEMQSKMDDLDWDIAKKLSVVLTEDQMLAYSKWVEEEAAKKPGDGQPEPPDGGKGGRPGPPRR